MQALPHLTGRATFTVLEDYVRKRGFMTKRERIEKEISKAKEQLAALQARLKDLEEQKKAAEIEEKLNIIEKHKISSEKLQLLIKFSEDEIFQLLAEKEKEKERSGHEETIIR